MTLADTLQAAPAHWLRQRAKVFLREVDERSDTGSEELLSVSHLTGVTPRSQKTVTMFKAATYSGHKRCEAGDLVINTLWAWMGALGVSRYKGLVSPAYGTYRCRDNGPAFSPGYLDYLARTPAYVAEYVRRSTGIQSSRLRLYPAQFLDIPLLFPPRDEQDQIVAFLRAQDAKLGRLVRAKQQLRTIAMDRAHGQWHRLLSPTGVCDRPIALEWPPNAGGRWPLRPLKYVARQITDQCVSQADDERYVALEHVESWTGTLTAPGGPVAFASTVKRFAQGDILFGKLRPYLAKVARPSFKGVCVSEFIVLRARSDMMEPAFLEAILRSKALIDRVAGSASGAKMPRTDWSVLGNLPIPVPSLDEQRQILASWSVLQKQSLALADQAKQGIDLALEYRTRLIADVITGQHDVRGWRPGADDVIDDAEASAAWDSLSGGAADEADDEHSLQGAAGDDEPDGHE